MLYRSDVLEAIAVLETGVRQCIEPDDVRTWYKLQRVMDYLLTQTDTLTRFPGCYDDDEEFWRVA